MDSSQKKQSFLNPFATFSSSEGKNDKAYYYQPGSPYSEAEYQEVKNLFEKCTRKSQNTKLKATSRIIEACQKASDLTLFIDLIPNWVYVFSRVVKYEPERAVREAALKVQHLFFKRFRTKFAQYLQDIFPSLWLARVDPSKEVAREADSAFSAAFPSAKQPKVVATCIERFMREAMGILKGELSESEEIQERLMSCSLLGVSEALNICPEVKEHLTVLLHSPAVWYFTEVGSYPPLVRCAALKCYHSFLKNEMLNQEMLGQSVTFVFALIKDNNRLVQGTLWTEVMIDLLNKFPQFPSYIDMREALKDLLFCLKRGGSGAGSSFYPALVKFISFFDEQTLKDKQTTQKILLAIISGLHSDEGSFHGKYILNAYYEVVGFVYMKVQELREDIDEFLVKPVELYLAQKGPLAPNSYFQVIPQLLAQLLGYLETKLDLPDISQDLFNMLSEAFSGNQQTAIDFLKALATNLSKQGPYCHSLIQNLIYILHSQLSQELENKLTLKDVPQLKLKMPLFSSFSNLAVKHSSFEPRVTDWWISGVQNKLDPKVMKSLASILQLYPEQWLSAVTFSIDNTEFLPVLIPHRPVMSLLKLKSNPGFLSIPSAIFLKLSHAATLNEVSYLTESINKLLSSALFEPQPVVTDMESLVTPIIEKEDPISFQKITQTFLAVGDSMSLNMSTLAGKFLAREGWKTQLSSLWELVKTLPPEIRSNAVQNAVMLVSDKMSQTQEWGRLLSIASKLVDCGEPEGVLSSLLTFENFKEAKVSENPWLLLEALAIQKKQNIAFILKDSPFLVPLLLACEIIDPLTKNLPLKAKVSNYFHSYILPEIQSELAFKNKELAVKILSWLIDLAREEQMRGIMMKGLKLIIEEGNWVQSELVEFFEFCAAKLENMQEIDCLCQVLQVCKLHIQPLKFEETVEKWRNLAYTQEEPYTLKVYAACLDDNSTVGIEGDIECLKKAVEKGLKGPDLALALNIARRGGFESLEGLLEPIELQVIELLVNHQNIKEVLPYIQKLLGSPQHIFNSNELTELLLNLPKNKELSQADLLELAETFTRLPSVVDPELDEHSIYLVLSQTMNIPLIKACFALLQDTYSRFETQKSMEEGIPGAAKEILNWVPTVQGEYMQPKVLVFIASWLLLLHKYRMDKHHREKTQEGGDSNFMTEFKDTLEKKQETVTVFLTTLLGYMHEETKLDPYFNVAWVDVLDEDSYGKLAALGMFEFLKTFPSLGRQWWLQIDRYLSNTVKNIVKNQISSVLFQEETKNIENRQVEWKSDDLNISCSKAGKDITATFNKDEFNMQVNLKFPSDYPLSSPDPQITKKVKISEEKMRRWSLSMLRLLQQENSSILEVILTWKKHVERELEGIEDCYICYYLVHPTDKSLPVLPCPTCQNKFHKLCIQKWFETSAKSNCPLCQNPFRA